MKQFVSKVSRWTAAAITTLLLLAPLGARAYAAPSTTLVADAKSDVCAGLKATGGDCTSDGLS